MNSSAPQGGAPVTAQVQPKGRGGKRQTFIGAWASEAEKRRLRALAALRGATESDTLRELINATPLEPEPLAEGPTPLGVQVQYQGK
jgi:hypothetical protein